jgi:lipopolysaccharide biosynthesis protein
LAARSESIASGSRRWRLAWGAAAGTTPDFFKGAMFRVRPAALAPLRALRLAEDSFAPETGQTHSALELLFNHAVEASGSCVADTSRDPDERRACVSPALVGAGAPG